MLYCIYLVVFEGVGVTHGGHFHCAFPVPLTFLPPGSDLSLSHPQIEKIMTLIGAGIEFSRDQHYATPGEVTSSQTCRQIFILHNKQILSVFITEEIKHLAEK